MALARDFPTLKTIFAALTQMQSNSSALMSVVLQPCFATALAKAASAQSGISLAESERLMAATSDAQMKRMRTAGDFILGVSLRREEKSGRKSEDDVGFAVREIEAVGSQGAR